MRLLYEHRNPAHTGRKISLIVIGAVMVAGLIALPPERLWVTWGLWAMATALQLAGVGLLLLPQVVHIWITDTEIILHPMDLHRRIPLQHIHDLRIDGPKDQPVLILTLRNGETEELTGWIGDIPKIAALLVSLGVADQEA